MKFLSLLCLWYTTTPLSAEERPRSVLIQTERFTLSQTEANELLQGNLSDDALRQEMLKRVSANTARLEQFILLRTTLEQRAKVEQVDEFPYVVEFDPPQIPTTLVLADAAGAAVLAAVASLVPPPLPVPPEQSPPAPPPPPGPLRNAGIGLQTTPTPVAMSVRKLGDMLEFHPSPSADGLSIRIDYTNESTRFLGDSVNNGTSHPNFQTQRVTGICMAKSGVTNFLGTCSKAIRSGVEHGQTSDELSLQFLTVFSHALPPSANPPLTDEQLKGKTVRGHFELISLPQATAPALIESHETDATMLDRLHEMIRSQSATLEASADFKTLSGIRTKVDQTTPFTYQTLFNVHLIPTKLTITDPTILDVLRLHGGGPTPDPSDLSQALIKVSPRDASSLTTRSLGFATELVPVLHPDGETISVTLAPESVSHVADRNFSGNLRPIFEIQKLNTSVILTRNAPVLLGTMSRPQRTGAAGGNEAQLVALAFLTVSMD